MRKKKRGVTPEAETEESPAVRKEKRRIHFLRRTAREVRQYHVLRKMLLSLLSILVVLMALMYMISVLYKHTGSFTVSMNKFDMQEYGLTLSESREMTHCTSQLDTKIDETITNISIKDLPADLDKIDGAHNGENHVAYTFYLQNIGSQTLDYEYTMFISGVTQRLDSAIRIRLYHNGEPVDYARTRSDGGGAEPGTTEFFSEQIVVQKLIKDFSPEEIDKFTVVIWIEGDDPDCVDFLIGGKLRVDMSMSVAE